MYLLQKKCEKIVASEGKLFVIKLKYYILNNIYYWVLNLILKDLQIIA